jgi:hypothetical protein
MRVDNLLETVGDDLIDGALFQRQVYHVIDVFVVVLSIFFLYKVVHVHQKFRSGAGAAESMELTDEDHVDEAAAERFQVRRCRRVAADAGRAADAAMDTW